VNEQDMPTQIRLYHKALDEMLSMWLFDNKMSASAMDYNFIDKALIAMLQQPELPHTLALEPYLDAMAVRLAK
jgi:hypothetical protein